MNATYKIEETNSKRGQFQIDIVVDGIEVVDWTEWADTMENAKEKAETMLADYLEACETE